MENGDNISRNEFLISFEQSYTHTHFYTFTPHTHTHNISWHLFMLLCTMLCMIQGGKCSRTNTLIEIHFMLFQWKRYDCCNNSRECTELNFRYGFEWPLVNTSSVLLSENGRQLWLVHQKWKGESSKRAKKKSNGNDKTGINVKLRDLFFPHAVFMLYDGFN